MYFYFFSGHFGFRPAVITGNVTASKSYGRTEAIHRGISAAYDNRLAGVLAFPVIQGKFFQPFNSLFRQFFAFNPHGAGLPASDSKGYGVILLCQLIKLNIFSEFFIAFDFNAHFIEMRDFPVEDFFREPVFGDTVTEHAAGLGHFLENNGVDTKPAQKKSGGKTGWTCAYNGYFFTCKGRQILFVCVVVKVCGKALEIINRDRFAGNVLAAVLFAEAGTYPAYAHGKRNAFLYNPQRFIKVSFASGADVFLHSGMSGTGDGAGSFAIALVFR